MVYTAILIVPNTTLLTGIGVPDVVSQPRDDNHYGGNGELFTTTINRGKPHACSFRCAVGFSFGQSLVHAPDGTIWIAAQEGILRIDPQNLTVEPVVKNELLTTGWIKRALARR